MDQALSEMKRRMQQAVKGQLEDGSKGGQGLPSASNSNEDGMEGGEETLAT